MSLSTKGSFQVDSVEFTPKSLKVNFESLSSENSGRTLDGVMHIYWVFNKIRKLEIEMAPMTAGEVAALLSRVQGKIYYITYFDPIDNAERTAQVYTSNSSTDVYSGIIRNGLYQGVQFNAIEIAGEIDYTVAPITVAFSDTGDLVMENNTPDVFTTEGNSLVVDVNSEGVSYDIDEEGGLWRVS